MSKEVNLIRPQAGFQENFLSTKADIAIGGAAAGVGKSFALLMEPLRHAQEKNFNAMFFRRESVQLTKPGQLLDTAQILYSKLAKPPRYTEKKFQFDSGVEFQFSHLEHEKDRFAYDGAQISYIAFDELIHFTRRQFVYLMSRNRSAECNVRPYMRATTNPEPYGWVKDMVSWYIYPDDYEIESLQGVVIPERAGKLRYFVGDGDKFIWGDSKLEVFKKARHIFTKELIESLASEGISPMHLIKSFTFIPGSIYDNKILMKNNPGYLGDLHSQSEQDKQRLLHGSWKLITGEDQIYNYQALKDMFTNDFIAGASSSRDKYIVADIALEGADRLVVGYWNGWRLEDVRVMAKSNGKEVIELIKSMAKSYSVPNQNIIYDSDGVGQFAGGFIPGARNFKGNGTPVAIPDPKTKQLHKEDYENLRSQCYFKLAEFVNECRIYIADQSFMNNIVSELHATRKRKYDGTKHRIISKDEIKTKLDGKSPDFADMIMMRVYGELLRLQSPGGGSASIYTA